MLSLLCLGHELEGDSRLAAHLSLRERYLPVADFVERLQTASKAPIRAEVEIRERKLAIFVDDRPVAEIMRMAAEALGARWVWIGDDWRLRPDPELRAAEARAAAQEADEAQRALTAWARRTVSDRLATSPLDQAVARLVRAVGERAIADRLSAGSPVVGTPSGEWGTPALGAVENRDLPDGTVLGSFRAVTLALRAGKIVAHLIPLDAQTGAGMSREDDLAPLRPSPSATLKQILKAWAVDEDPAVLGKSLSQAKGAKEPYPNGLMALADGLARIHQRARIPIAYESFRVPDGVYREVAGSTVRTALDDLARPGSPLLTAGAGFRYRTQKGWLLVRDREPWRLRPGEIPERALESLERRPPSLDAYADLARDLTAPQRAALRAYRPVAAFPTLPLQLGSWGLAVYGSLTSSQKSEAKRGIALKDLPPAARAHWTRAMETRVFESAPQGSWIGAFLTGRAPEGAGFRASLETVALGAGIRTPGAAPQFGAPMERGEGIVFHFSLTEPRPSDMVPLPLEAP